jgi:hypothetical protein
MSSEMSSVSDGNSSWITLYIRRKQNSQLFNIKTGDKYDSHDVLFNHPTALYFIHLCDKNCINDETHASA